MMEVKNYHERTKHRIDRYAEGPGYLDWDTQPNPYRSFTGAPVTPLPLTSDELEATWQEIHQPGAVKPAPINLNTMGGLFELSLGLSAWKEYGEARWALRCNPSSGNLHPTEAYLVSNGTGGIPSGVFHYDCYNHQLELRVSPAGGFPMIPSGAFLIGVSSIHWREAWKYGERGYRYSQLDLGHAAAAVRYAAATLGWRASIIPDVSDADLETLLGLNRADDFKNVEMEHPGFLILIDAIKDGSASFGAESARQAAETARTGAWHGAANVLSATHAHQWPIIEGVASAAVKPATVETPWSIPTRVEPVPTFCDEHAAHVIKRRRSAQAFDAETTMPQESFYRMLDVALPRSGVPPMDAFPWEPRIHLAIFAHRIEGLKPGLYIFLRRDGAYARLRAAMRPEFVWTMPEDIPPHLPLFHLTTADGQRAARMLACHQQIASDGAFAVGMLSEMGLCLNEGAWWYRRLFWEAGAIGQALYLEAETMGLRGAGLGCYFDDAFHDMLGLKDQTFQSLYHFTVGTAVEDTRLATLPPYGHLSGR